MQTRHHLCKAGGNGIRSWLAIGPCVPRFPWLKILVIESQLLTPRVRSRTARPS